jgi:hypothetical protein
MKAFDRPPLWLSAMMRTLLLNETLCERSGTRLKFPVDKEGGGTRSKEPPCCNRS